MKRFNVRDSVLALLCVATVVRCIASGDAGPLSPQGGNAVSIGGVGTHLALYSGTGATATLGDSNIIVLNPATPPVGSTTCGIQEAITACGTSPCTVHIGKGACTVTTTITIANHRQNVEGEGEWDTEIDFNPATAIPMFVFSAGASVLYQTRIGGFGAFDPGSAAVGPIIQSKDTSEFYVHDVASLNWLGNGLELHGRELNTIERVAIQANNPIAIEANPNTTIQLDAFAFRDNYLLPMVGSAACITVSGVASGTIIQHWRMDGIDCIGGQYGVYSSDSVGASAWLDWDWRSMHWEQQTGSNGYFIYLVRSNLANIGVINWTLTGIDAGGDPGHTSSGFFIRDTLGLTATNLVYQNTSRIALDLDSSNSGTTLINPFFQSGSTVSFAPAGNSTINGGSVTGTNYNLATNASVTTAINSAVSGTSTFIPCFTGAHTIGNCPGNHLDNGTFTTFAGAVAIADSGGDITATGASNTFTGNVAIDGVTLLAASGPPNYVQYYGPLQGINVSTITIEDNPTTGHRMFESPNLTNTNLSSCGSSPSIAAASVDEQGGATPGTGSPTACTVTFANTYTTTGQCQCWDTTNPAHTCTVSSLSATAFTVTLGTGGDSFKYQCNGFSGGT